VTNTANVGRVAEDAATENEQTAVSSLDTFFSRLAEDATQYDFYYAMRRIDAAIDGRYPLGRAPRPRDEPLRLSQHPSLMFAPATLYTYKEGVTTTGLGRLTVHHFGMFGPHGAMPQHLTEYVQERVLHHKDESMLRFCDIFQHRMILLSYRAWADCQAATSLDHPGRDSFTRYASSLIGLGQENLRNRDTVPDHLKLHHAGHLVRQSRNPDGLAQALQALVRSPVRLGEYCLQWLRLSEDDRTRLSSVASAGDGSKQRIELGDASSRLGMGAVAGSKVPDVQHKFRLRIGPTRLVDFERFLPGGDRYLQVRDWVRNYLGVELAWDVQVVLRRDEVPAATLGQYGKLGWTSWLGTPPERRKKDVDDVILDIERLTSVAGVH
jgi:type VI secretion system protein ImpH